MKYENDGTIEQIEEITASIENKKSEQRTVKQKVLHDLRDKK
jgi:hypothetical protein